MVNSVADLMIIIIAGSKLRATMDPLSTFPEYSRYALELASDPKPSLQKMYDSVANSCKANGSSIDGEQSIEFDDHASYNIHLNSKSSREYTNHFGAPSPSSSEVYELEDYKSDFNAEKSDESEECSDLDTDKTLVDVKWPSPDDDTVLKIEPLEHKHSTNPAGDISSTRITHIYEINIVTPSRIVKVDTPAPMTITIPSRTVKVKTAALTTISMLKSMLNQNGIEGEFLVFDDEMLGDESKTLSEYQIYDGAEMKFI